MRKIALFPGLLMPLNCLAKSGCERLQVPESGRPVIVNKEWTPPSGFPFSSWMNRTSRTGPSAVMKLGAVFVPALYFLRKLICGLPILFGGLVPPAAGYAWHPTQLSRFMVGPNPSLTVSALRNSSRPAQKNLSCSGVNPGSGSGSKGCMVLFGQDAGTEPRDETSWTPGSWALKGSALAGEYAHDII